jgi:hypothetical protein
MTTKYTNQEAIDFFHDIFNPTGDALIDTFLTLSVIGCFNSKLMSNASSIFANVLKLINLLKLKKMMNCMQHKI